VERDGKEDQRAVEKKVEGEGGPSAEKEGREVSRGPAVASPLPGTPCIDAVDDG
jgi:hypothetical protein